MPDSLPLFKPGQAITRQASAAITGGQLCIVTGSGTVGPSAAASVAWLGVAAFDAGTGENVTLHKGGVHRLVASGAITAGDAVIAAAAGAVATGAGTVGQQVGVALTTATNGQLVEVDLVR